MASDNSKSSCSNSMRLFGLPYQFIETVDPRIPTVSSVIGTNFVKRIITDAPTVIFIPGKAKFLPNATNKNSTAHMLLENANGNISFIANATDNNATNNVASKFDKLRFYDFEEDYVEYMKCVNIMCRTVATFLEIHEYIDVGGKKETFQTYDWKNYRWNRETYKSAAGAVAKYAWNSTIGTITQYIPNVVNGLRSGSLVNFDFDKNDSGTAGITATNNFVQFYVDPTSGASQSMSNTTGPSSIKGTMDGLSQTVREFQWLTNTAGGEAFQNAMGNVDQLTTGMLDALINEDTDDKIASSVNRILGVGSQIIHGANVILPDIYQSSEYGIDYTVDIHLKSPYGNKYSVFMDVIAPMLHILGLVLPRQSTSNTYGSPFLIKAYFPGVFNCNLGIVESVQITKPVSEDAWSVDGLPMEVDVQIRIKDLYSDLQMSPSTDKELFANNTSLIDYLATVSGLDLISPQLEKKLAMNLNNFTAGVKDIDNNFKSYIGDKIEKAFSGFVTL